MTAFKTQQARWAKGLIQTARKFCRKVLQERRAAGTSRAEACYHLTANLSYPLMIVLSVLLLPAMIIRFYQGWFQMLYIDLPLFMASTFSISSFYLVSQRELFPKTWPRALLYLPFLMALGIGLTITNTQRRSGGSGRASRRPSHELEVSASDRKKDKGQERQQIPQTPRMDSVGRVVDWLPISHRRSTTRIDNENYITVPFLLLVRCRLLVHRADVAAARGRFTGLALSAETHTRSSFPVGSLRLFIDLRSFSQAESPASADEVFT